MIKGLISIIMPTMRTSGAALTIGQTLRTTVNHKIEFIVVTENKELKAFAERTLDTWKEDNLEDWRVLYKKEPRGCVKAWNDGLAVSRGEYIVLWSDDVYPHEGWLDKALPYFSRFPSGIGYVGFNDLYWMDGNTLTTFYIAHRQHVIQYQNGVLGFPHYRFLCNDTEAWARARKADRWIWAEDAITEHLHHTTGKRKKDMIDMVADAAMEQDFDEYERRKALGFPDDFEPVITE